MTENSFRYRGGMPPTPERGNEIREISGDAAAIISRGRTMQSLGDRMQRAANTLQHLADGTVGKGLSIEQLRSDAEDVHSDLKTAGIRYSPSGAAVKAYGEALDDAQTALRPIISDCEALWEVVQSASSALAGADEEGEDAKQSAFDTAVAEWEAAARSYDGPYEAWDAAYETARDGLEEANESGVEDSRWDDFVGALDTFVTILGWVGVALVVVALVIGGPIVAAIALVVGVVALLGTIILAVEGRKTGTDVAFAALSIVPFGKLAKLGPVISGASRGSRVSAVAAHFGDDFIRGAQNLRSTRAAAAQAWSGMGNRVIPELRQATLGTQAIMQLRHTPWQLPGSYGDVVRRLGGFQPGQVPGNLAEGLGGMADAMFGSVYPTLDTVSDAVQG